MIEVTLFGRQNCHLCDVAKADLESLKEEIPHNVEVVDVDSSPELKKEYGFIIPVVKVGPYQLKAPFTRQELEVTLRAAQFRHQQIAAVDESYISSGNPTALTWTKADRFSHWLSKHYMLFLNTLVLVYVGLPLLAPVLMNYGAQAPAAVIYRVYGAVCHQLAYRSWFLFGEQSAYPKIAAGVPDLVPFEQSTGLAGDDLLAARAFLGNEVTGYKIALCQRDVAIYGSILVFGLLFVLSGRRIPPLPWYIWVAVGLVPVGLDGVSQLISQPPLNLISYRESTPELRLLTGALFGFMTAWFGYPMVEETMVESRRYLDEKAARIKRLARRKAEG